MVPVRGDTHQGTHLFADTNQGVGLVSIQFCSRLLPNCLSFIFVPFSALVRNTRFSAWRLVIVPFFSSSDAMMRVSTHHILINLNIYFDSSGAWRHAPGHSLIYGHEPRRRNIPNNGESRHIQTIRILLYFFIYKIPKSFFAKICNT
jgi:hypothetical protein